ncbi:MAG: helix-turn-helix transcriptional regulator [Dehalococcoidia bacterium]|nr:helix-turn-helix transcriptional regulator [Dehalococcoidia bacterium]
MRSFEDIEIASKPGARYAGPTVETLQEFKADLFRTLANPTRVRIMELLRLAGSLTVSELQQRLEIESSNVSQHLAILRARGLVTTRREGTSIWYAVADPAIFDLLDAARAVFEHQLEARTRLLAE